MSPRRVRRPIEQPDDDLDGLPDPFDPNEDGAYDEGFESASGEGGDDSAVTDESADESELVPEDIEEEALRELPAGRRETRQEVLGRLMRRLLTAREHVHQSLEQVRSFNTEMREAAPRPQEKLREQFQHNIQGLSSARREENFARSELIQMLGWRG